MIGERMMCTAQYYLGDLLSARRHIERVLADDVAPAHKSQIVRFEVDPSVAARVYLARILWLQGLPDQAMQIAESSVAEARATNHAMSLGHALAVAACPIALFMGDLAAAEHYVEMLLDHSTRHALARWRAFGRSYQGVVLIPRGALSTRSTGRAGKARSPGNCVAPRALPDCGAIRLEATRRANFWRRFMIGSPRAMIPPISKRQRRCSRICHNSKRCPSRLCRQQSNLVASGSRRT